MRSGIVIVIAGITARSIFEILWDSLELLGIIWNYFWNSLKIYIKFHRNSRNYCHSGRFLLKIGINSKNAKFELTASYISIQESTIQSISSLIFYKDVSALFTLGELQPYAYHTRLKFAKHKQSRYVFIKNQWRSVVKTVLKNSQPFSRNLASKLTLSIEIPL